MHDEISEGMEIDEDLAALFGGEPADVFDDDADDEAELMPLGDVIDAVNIERELIISRDLAEAEARVRSHETDRMFEQLVLGQALATPDYLDEPGTPRLTIDDWSEQPIALAMRALLTLRQRGEDVSPTFVGDQMRRTGDLEAAGGFAWLLALQREHRPMGLASFQHACRRVADAARGRRIERVCRRSIVRLETGESDAMTIGREAASGIEHALDGVDVDADVDVGAVMETIAKTLPILGGTVKRCLSTGFPVIDAKLTGGGLARGELILIAARPGTGKTALATDIVRDVCVRRHLPVGLFSLEMKDEAFLVRALPAEAGVPIETMQKPQGDVDPALFHRVINAQRRLAEAPLHMSRDARDGELSALVARARRWRRRHRIELLMIDYLQLIEERGTRRAGAKQHEVLGAISRTLKKLAVELDIPIVALAQLNRDSEKGDGPGRAPRKPVISDLRGSGDLEQDADVIVLLHKEAAAAGAKTVSGRENLVDAIIAKNRNGPAGAVTLGWNDAIASFSDPSKAGLL
jgi:replicative DNA helicase